MADPVSVGTIGLAIFPLSRITDGDSVRQFDLLHRSYGKIVALIVTVGLPGTASRYERIEQAILNGPDANAAIFRQAGAIIAQVAITGLSLPNLSSSHWVVHALLLLGVVSGCLSVYYACSLQRSFGTLYSAKYIKAWLRLPPPKDIPVGDTTQASLAAVLILGAPFTMVKVSIVAFLLGLTIYQGLVWTRSLETQAANGDSRNMFMTFMITNGVCILFFAVVFSLKGVENMRMKSRPATVTISANNPGDINIPIGPMVAAAVDVDGPQVGVQAAIPTAGDGESLNSLTVALRIAAEAHAKCADVEYQVALEYEKISRPG